MAETEVWFRNPHNYARELVDANYGWVAWDRGLVHKRNIDVVNHADLFFGQTIPYRILLIGEQGTAELGPGRKIDNPIAVYPTWCYGDEQMLLEELVERPVGEDEKLCNMSGVLTDERPVFGQEHRVVIVNPPDAGMVGGRSFYRYLKQLQEDHPGVILHLHGSYSFRMMFGMGYRSADCDPRTSAGTGKIILPSGKTVKHEQGMDKPKWFAATGFLPVDMKIPRNRCIFNIKSALWAGKNFGELVNFSVQKSQQVDSESSDGAFVPRRTRPQLLKKLLPTDMVSCDTCSLAKNCKYERDGAVCSVPGAEMASLGKFFRTRDSGQIMDGLSELLARNAQRLEAGMESEEAIGELDPEVSKVAAQVFDQGVKLAKLIDPSLNGANVSVNVLNQNGSAQIQRPVNSKELLASAVRELERQGIKREDITPTMIETMLVGIVNRPQAIEGTVIKRDTFNDPY